MDLGRSLAISPLVALTLGLAASAQQLKLNGPLARPIGGDVQDFFLTADGEHLVYRADQGADDVSELHARARGAFAARRISAPMVAGGQVLFSHPALVSVPLGRVLYVADGETDGQLELFSAALAGGDVVKLNGPLAPEMDLTWSVREEGLEGIALAPDGGRAVFLVRAAAFPPVYQLFSVPAGGGAAVRLDQDGQNPRRFRLAPDGSAVVFASSTPKVELFRVPLAGGPAVKLTPDHASPDEVTDTFEIAPSTLRVVFRARLAGAVANELFSVPLDASSAALRLAPGAVPVTGSTPYFRISSDGTRVLAATTSRELVSAPLDGGAAAVSLLGPLPAGRRIDDYRAAPDSRTALVRADPFAGGDFEWLRAPLDGSAATVSLTPGTTSSLAASFSPDGALLLYAGLESTFGLHTVLVDGSAVPVLVTPLASGIYSADFAPDGAHVIVHGSLTLGGPVEVASVPTTGGTLQALNGPLAFGGSVAQLSGPGDRSVVVSADGQHVVYLADERADEQYELFTAPTDGALPARRVTPTMPLGPVLGDVLDYALTGDGERAIFRAAAEVAGQPELFASRLGRRGSPLLLSDALKPGERVDHFVLTPDGTHVVYVLWKSVERVAQLRSVEATGGDTRLLAEAALLGLPSVTPDGARVVFGSGDVSDLEGLYSVPVDGSAAPILLDGSGSTPVQIQFDAVGRVVYLASEDYRGRLFSVPADGSAARLELSNPQLVPGRVSSFQMNAARDTVVFTADHQQLYRFDLLAAPTDGSTPARVLVAPPADFRGVFNFALHGDAAFFVARFDDPRFSELYRVPLDGSTAPLKLSGALRTGVGHFRVSPDGARVVYLADETEWQHMELFSVPSTGGTPVKLSGPRQRGEVGGASFFDDGYEDPFVIAPDSARVLFRADLQNAGAVRLYSVPIAGGSLPIVLDPAPGSAAVLSGLRFAPDGSVIGRAARLLDGPAGTETFLFRADPARARSARLVSGLGTWITRQPELDFTVLPDGARIVFRHDQESDGVVELFLGFLPRGREHAAQR